MDLDEYGVRRLQPGEPMPLQEAAATLDHNEAQKWFLRARALLAELSEKPIEAAYLMIAEPRPDFDCGAPDCKGGHWQATIVCTGRDDILTKELANQVGELMVNRMRYLQAEQDA